MKPLITILTLSFLVLCAFLMRPSDRDIQICVETTNYSAERCLTEIMR